MEMKRNPVAEQSCRWLAQALVRLMQGKPYRSITIVEITREAQLARRTFYRNFASKDELLSFYAEELCEEYAAHLAQQADLQLPNIARAFFSFWSEHLDFLRLMERNQMSHLLLHKFNEYLPGLHANFKKEVVQQFRGNEETISYALTFSAGGFWNILSRWMREGAKRSPDEMAAIVDMASLLVLQPREKKLTLGGECEAL